MRYVTANDTFPRKCSLVLKIEAIAGTAEMLNETHVLRNRKRYFSKKMLASVGDRGHSRNRGNAQ